MKNFLEYLIKDIGFNKNNDRSVEKKLFEGCNAVLTQDDEVENGIYFYINSPKFSDVMFSIFSDSKGNYDYESKAHQYMARKLRKDRTGNLAMGLLNYKSNDSLGELSNGGISISVQEFSKLINNIDSVSKLYKSLYFSSLNNLVATIEGVWVYIYLCYEAGMQADDILLSLMKNEVSKDQMNCVLKKDIDLEMIHIFLRQLDQVKNR